MWNGLPSPVYPRPRGGTAAPPRQSAVRSGLSPPTRGNLGRRRDIRARERSIPAHAGEPPMNGETAFAVGVYPRPRGGTASAKAALEKAIGLSPPTRGNRGDAAGELVRLGSIPAHAGEPVLACEGRSPPAVYPRPRGGTRPYRRNTDACAGLSPPTRGNRAAACIGRS